MRLPRRRAGTERRVGPLEHFLTERYCLFQPAEGELRRNTMGEQVGLALDDEPLLHLAGVQDVLMWRIRPTEPDRA